ncbi:MAG: DUF1588 domain-containing protein [Gammaproteobacteria bacterium]|nr:DUF1588 domain-containing protein [Gammaproteobacteria bacterium]
MAINSSITLSQIAPVIKKAVGLGFFSGMIVTASLAATTSLTPLVTISSDGQDSAATVSIGLSNDGGSSYLTSLQLGAQASITANINPDPVHVGVTADIYIVQRIGNTFSMKDTDGQFLEWDVKAKTLVPAIEAVNLSADNPVEVYTGAFNTAGPQRVYVGYLPTGSSGLIFNPVAAKFEITEAATDALAFFEDNIADQIVSAKCIICHVENGVADGQTALIYSNDPDETQQNFDVLSDFFFSRDDALDYILSKASGGDGHVGGVQLATGSNDYSLFEQFLLLLEGSSIPVDTSNNAEQFFAPLVMQSDQQTLRRAALLMAGRLPTAAEKSALIGLGNAKIQNAVRGLMEGENFHEFLKDAANDRLLVRGNQEGNILNACRICFPGFAERLFELEEAGLASGSNFEERQYQRIVGMGLVESPLELVAYVIENDLPYSEILTADYALFNPALNEAVGGTAIFQGDSKALTFEPGIMEGYYRQNGSAELELVDGIQVPKIIDPGNLQTDYPHAGVLNSNVFLSRYPSTATNRNRARARWTYYHFLGFDIEASAPRTQEAEALADTNNPTLNNSNCTVCHQIMDPVAGAYQNYGNGGFYRSSRGGNDSLDRFYKFPEEGNSLYMAGDTWYQDMREPGFEVQSAPDADNSVQWLAQEIVNDPRFAVATVRFWWPAVIGSELVTVPKVETDQNYQDRLLAYDAQQSTINELADSFVASGMNLKDLLVDLIMSEWFRAESYDDPGMALEAHAIASIGNEKLLTPEQLSRKTQSITGFNWNSWLDPQLDIIFNGLEEQFALFYGGIDSLNIKERSREMTPLMSIVPMAHGLQASCPIVLREFTLADEDRLLFSGVSEFDTPLSIVNQLAVIDSEDNLDIKTYSLSTVLQPGAKNFSVSYLNDFCEYDEASNSCLTDRNIFITEITVIPPNGTRLEIPGSDAQLANSACGGISSDGFAALFDNCRANYSFNATQAGQYTVEVDVSASQAGDELALINLSLEEDADPLVANTPGADLIKTKLVNLYDLMLGRDLTVSSPEIISAYQLFAESWESRRGLGVDHLFNQEESCYWFADVEFGKGIGFTGEPLVLAGGANSRRYEVNWQELYPFLEGFASDTQQTKQSWKTVMTYLLTHYDYLYE